MARPLANQAFGRVKPKPPSPTADRVCVGAEPQAARFDSTVSGAAKQTEEAQKKKGGAATERDAKGEDHAGGTFPPQSSRVSQKKANGEH